MGGIDFNRPFCGLPLRFCSLKPYLHSNASDDQNIVFHLYFANSLGLKVIAVCRDPTHLQCAIQGSHQTSSCGADHIIERCSVRCVGSVGNLVVFGDRAVHSHRNRLRLDWQMNELYPAGPGLDTNPRAVDYFVS